MNRFVIYSLEYRPKQVWFPRHVRKALKKALADAIIGASAITSLVAASMI